MILIDAKGATLGRLASYVAKEALKGEEIRIFNCSEAIITGNFISTKEDFKIKRSRVGQSQKGPKHPAISEKMVKRVIRGMLPNFREGRGREAFKRIICYSQTPKEFEDKEMQTFKVKRIKYSKVGDFAKK